MKFDPKLAGMEGWGVFTREGIPEIQRIDDMSVFCPNGDGNPVFVGDDEAVAFVRAEAENGDKNARAALKIIADDWHANSEMLAREL